LLRYHPQLLDFNSFKFYERLRKPNDNNRKPNDNNRKPNDNNRKPENMDKNDASDDYIGMN